MDNYIKLLVRCFALVILGLGAISPLLTSPDTNKTSIKRFHEQQLTASTYFTSRIEVNMPCITQFSDISHFPMQYVTESSKLGILSYSYSIYYRHVPSLALLTLGLVT